MTTKQATTLFELDAPSPSHPDKDIACPAMPKDLIAAGYRLVDTVPGPGWRWAHGTRGKKITGPYQSVAPTPQAAIEDARKHFERCFPLFSQRVTPPLDARGKL